MRPASISFFSSSVSALRDGTSSATFCSFGSFSSFLSWAAFWAPPGPRIIAFPWPLVSTEPPSTAAMRALILSPSRAFFTDSETCCALPLSVCEVANITTKKANSKVMKSA
jgi:hypothetical protein